MIIMGRLTKNSGLAGGMIGTAPKGTSDEVTDLLRLESRRTGRCLYWMPHEARLYIEIGLDQAEYHANWGVS